MDEVINTVEMVYCRDLLYDAEPKSEKRQSVQTRPAVNDYWKKKLVDNRVRRKNGIINQSGEPARPTVDERKAWNESKSPAISK
jgi:hypothetical protein